MGQSDKEVVAHTKHERIIQYIDQLKVGTRLSVRTIAEELEVSEGTAYKAIKEAEALGLVSTKERIGTVRINRKKRDAVERLTFAEVADIVEGQLLGGAAGLNKTLHKFVIGAMELEAMRRYIDAGSLLIVGNREGAHGIAMEQEAGVLITGGFGTSDEMKRIADERGLPVISSKFDTYTVASMINRAMFDRLIKQKIMLVEDIVTYSRAVETMRLSETAGDFHRLVARTSMSRFPVLDDRGRVVGMMTMKDAEGADESQTIDKLMTRHPITAAPNIPIVSAAHTMTTEGIDLLPIVDKNRKLLAAISRSEVLEAMRYTSKHQESGETFDDLIRAGFAKDEHGGEDWVYRGRITPQMSGLMGTISEGVLVTLMVQAARGMIRELGKRELGIESLTTYFIKPLQLESDVSIVPQLLEMSRKIAKLEIELQDASGLAAKAMLTAQLIDPF
ncbi:putative transcriptional regulator [Paenibacillus phyllosphaerae]|uniref:Putative transcriptional regulator n=1 Tax=Paenibacillus phyllosphaerae TaxID=274593 RepID=A0A7W5AT64_9BACL|nr:DRTGG domain-containing protein [Paenibacillus phyllosphaerae]MBB3108273.1 putative transcriptional regulator [Paenibacillus phyllosphaerae]